ncbi:Hypothetical protein A7982_02833 [Minicystis rosea]|nr:Hypothetical protein A7982_02833 [Minicystis rosea]
MTFRTVPVFAAVLLAVASARPARACSPPSPGVYDSTPKNGATYPANAAIFFSGYDVSLDDVTVTVDGQPATLAKATLTSSPATLSVVVQPAPEPGQVVAIQGTFCGSGFQCPVYSLSFTAAPPDTTAPGAPKVIAFNVHDYVDFKSSGGDCQSNSDLAYWVEMETPALEAGGSPFLQRIEAYRDAGLTDFVFGTTRFVEGGTKQVISFHVLASELAGASPADAFCFRSTIVDAAGNAGPDSAEVICKPCHVRIDDEPSTSFGAPPEPAWSSDDIYPGGACDPGGPGTGGAGTGGSGAGGDGGSDEAQVIGGCGCRVGEGEGGAGTMGGALAMIGAAVRVLRRRKRA